MQSIYFAGALGQQRLGEIVAGLYVPEHSFGQGLSSAIENALLSRCRPQRCRHQCKCTVSRQESRAVNRLE